VKMHPDINTQQILEICEVESEIQTLPQMSVEETSVTKNRKDELAHWAKYHNIKHVALNDLLKLVREWLSKDCFPKDSRTLLKTPRNVNLTEIGGGQLYHFGIANCVRQALLSGTRIFVLPDHTHFDGLENLITITIGIDGLPISKKSNFQFWPIMCCVDQAVDSSVYLISLFYGQTKTLDIGEFLTPLIEEMRRIEIEGILFNGVCFNLRIRCIVADAPARSFIKCTKNHNAYYGCERCYRKGKWANRVTYPKSKVGELYTDESFRCFLFPNHHEGTSPLINLKLGMISQVPLDYMHLICRGVVKKLLLAWTSGPLTVRLGPKQISIISRRLIAMRAHIPQEFNSKCRSLKELKHWKATKFRSFILYVGPVALKGVLNGKMFEHFML
jgi:hypothetical protein